MGRRASEALALSWKQRITRQRRSALSVSEFCKREGVSVNSFYVWRKRLRVEGLGSRVGRSEGAVSQPSRHLGSRLFVPITMPPSAVSAGGLRMELPGGAVLTLPADASAELLTTAIRAAIVESPEERPSC